mmetsp:Transcript_13033/g.52550  ORF Transcript_13033/g.52550 Transcript_13033/m.52550 type:complete len:384 (+) Transcript_13033:1802-2953(+)
MRAVGTPVAAPAAVRTPVSAAVRTASAVSPVLVEQPAAAARHLRSLGDVANLRDFPGGVGAIGPEVKHGDDARLGSRVQSAPVLVHQHLSQRIRRAQTQDARQHAGQRAVVAHLPAPSLPPRVRRGVFNLVQSLVVAGEEDATVRGARDVLGHDVVRGAAVVEGVEGELVVQGRSLAAVAKRATHEDNLHGGGHHQDVVDGAEEDAGPGLGEAHGDDGLLLAAVLHGHVVGPVQAPEEERVVDGGPGAIDLGQDATEAHRLARRVPLQDDGRELARARRRDLGRPPELLEGIRLPRGLPEQRDEVHAVALGLEVGHQTRGVLHLLRRGALDFPTLARASDEPDILRRVHRCRPRHAQTLKRRSEAGAPRRSSRRATALRSTAV